MANKTQIVNIVQVFTGTDNKSFAYKVKSTTNRLTPHVGEFLSERQVRDLIQSPNTKVNIS